MYVAYLLVLFFINTPDAVLHLRLVLF